MICIRVTCIITDAQISKEKIFIRSSSSSQRRAFCHAHQWPKLGETCSDIDEDLDVVLLILDQCSEPFALNTVKLDRLGDHAAGVHLPLGNGLQHGLEVAQAVRGTVMFR